MFSLKPPAGLFLPLPHCFPHSDRRALYLATVARPPPDAMMHRGQNSFVRECLEQVGIGDLTQDELIRDFLKELSVFAGGSNSTVQGHGQAGVPGSPVSPIFPA